VLDRVPPHNFDAEKAVVGIMLQYSDKIAVVMDKLRAEHFYKSDNRRIYDVITKLFMGNKPVDTISVKSELKDCDSKNIDLYFIECMESVPSGENSEHYCNLIFECFKKRKIIEYGMRIISESQDGKQASEIVDCLQNDLIHMADNRVEKSIEVAMHEINERIDKVKDHNGIIGIPSNLYELDEMTCGFQNSLLYLIAGKTSSGKTSLALQIAKDTAKKGIPVGIFSLEMSTVELTARFLAQEAKVDLKSILNGTIRFNTDALERYTKTATKLSLSGQNIIIDENSRDIISVRAKAKAWATRYGIKLIILDYLQLLDEASNITKAEAVGKNALMCRWIAKDLGVPFILLSQVTPGADDALSLRWSKDTENHADVTLIIGDKDGQKFIQIKKQRNGPTGTVPVTFLGKHTLFTNFANEGAFNG
jgi:replicative DNA helicase